jgi:hypothetical protein
MLQISYFLLALLFLIIFLYCLSFKKHYIGFTFLIGALLIFAVNNAKTNEQMLVDMLWIAWVVIYNGSALIVNYTTKGKKNIFENKFLFWGLYIISNTILAIVRFLFLV